MRLAMLGYRTEGWLPRVAHGKANHTVAAAKDSSIVMRKVSSHYHDDSLILVV